jgi:hypothetical protein
MFSRDLLNVLQMLYQIFDKDDNVIQIYDHKRVYEQPQDVIHHPYGCFLSIIRAKRHDQPLKKAFFMI